jgi:hypothetical protein
MVMTAATGPDCYTPVAKRVVMSLRVVCIDNGTPQSAVVSTAVAAAVRKLQLPQTEVLEVAAPDLRPFDLVADCNRLALIEAIPPAVPEYKELHEALEAASDMGLDVPGEVLAVIVEGPAAVARAVERVQRFALAAPANRSYDNSLCKTDACDICIGQSACVDKLVVKPS